MAEDAPEEPLLLKEAGESLKALLELHDYYFTGDRAEKQVSQSNKQTCRRTPA
jgi:hypothetical protein